MSDLVHPPQTVQVPPLPTRSLKLGRRVNEARWPRSLAGVRDVAKKVAWTAFEARLVDTPGRYVLREFVGSDVGEYRLRAGGGRFCVRHRSGDIDILRKFYAYGYYDWPPEVATAVARVGRPVNVLDLGANIGFFDVHVAQQAQIGNVVCFEPDPDNSAILERTRVANRAEWSIIRACASNREGRVMFNGGRKNFSRIGSDGDIEVPAIDVFPYFANADLIKMNIEGSEWEILEDSRLADTAAIWIVEYHRIRNPSDDITAAVRSLFERVGYTTRVAVSHGDNGLLWAWREAQQDGPGR
jgi:FkbM family methyltransferase